MAGVTSLTCLDLRQGKLDVVAIGEAGEVMVHVLKDHVDAALGLVLLCARV